jgi:hypothetical protein
MLVAVGLAGCGAEATPAALSSLPPPDAAIPLDLAAPLPIDAARDEEVEAAPDAPPDAARDAVWDLATDVPIAEDLRCNGHASLCDRRFDEVVFPTSHNAMSNADDGWFIPNQTHNMRRQLGDGIRAMLIDTYRFNGRPFLCHSNCGLGNRPLADALEDLADFLGENPHEVLALLVEDYLDAAETEAVFTAAGLTPFVHVQQPGAAWPTLRQMIASGRRLVVTAQNGRPPPAWYHAMWDLIWDTPYTFRSRAELSCRLNRGKTSNALFLLNHWIENPVPDPRLSTMANTREVLMQRARQCQEESGKLPNFVAVNHYSIGDLFEVVRALNGI